jgi:protein-tyrosine phosphatase
MIDLHTHILPGLDDGASDMDEALSILRAMAAEGITKVVATPHVIPGGYDNGGRVIADAVGFLQKHADAEDITIEIVTGAENYITPDLPERIARDPALVIAGGPFVLAELPMGEIPPYTEGVLHRMVASGLQPIIAHPERNGEIMNDPSCLMPLLQEGAILQINAGSLLGLHGPGSKRAAESIVKAGHPFLIASDIHRAENAEVLLRAMGHPHVLFASEAAGYLNISQFLK